LQQRLAKTGGQLVKHALYYWLLLAERRMACGQGKIQYRKLKQVYNGGYFWGQKGNPGWKGA